MAKLIEVDTPEDVILGYIKASPRPYALTAEEMLNLRKLGGSSKVQAAMLEHDRVLQAQQRKVAAVEKVLSAENKAAAASAQEPVRGASRAPSAGSVTGSNDGVERIPPPPPLVVPPPKPLKRAWTSTVVVEQPPPPPKLEWVPVAPGRDYCWVPGQWAWRGGQWVWQGGYWLHRPRPGLVWVDGYWAKHGRGWIWMPGRWR